MKRIKRIRLLLLLGVCLAGFPLTALAADAVPDGGIVQNMNAVVETVDHGAGSIKIFGGKVVKPFKTGTFGQIRRNAWTGYKSWAESVWGGCSLAQTRASESWAAGYSITVRGGPVPADCDQFLAQVKAQVAAAVSPSPDSIFVPKNHGVAVPSGMILPQGYQVILRELDYSSRKMWISHKVTVEPLVFGKGFDGNSQHERTGWSSPGGWNWIVSDMCKAAASSANAFPGWEINVAPAGICG